MTSGELLRSIRRRRALTQAELARAVGTTQPVISMYERDVRDPGVETLRRFVSAAGEQLVLDAVPPHSDLPPPASPGEHARRLHDVLSLADAVPRRRRPAKLEAPRLVSS